MIEVVGELQRHERLGVPVLLLEPRGDVAEFAQRGGGVAHFGGELAGAQARVEVFGIERAEADRDLGGALA